MTEDKVKEILENLIPKGYFPQETIRDIISIASARICQLFDSEEKDAKKSAIESQG